MESGGGTRSHTAKRALSASRVLLTCLLLATCGVLLAGCVESDTITQVIYDQNKNNEIDKDAVPLLNNSPDAKETSDQLPQLTTDKNSAKHDKTDANLPVYGGNVMGALVAQPQPAKTPNPEQSPVPKRKSHSRTLTLPSGQPSEDGTGEGKAPKEGSGKKKDKKKGENPDEAGENNTASGPGKEKEEEKKEEDPEVYRDYGDEFEEQAENVTHVACVGDAALIVTMLTIEEEEYPLVAADAEFLGNEQIAKVFGSEKLEGVKKVWKHDGSGEDDLTDATKLTEMDPKPDIVWVTENEESVKGEKAALEKAGITVETLPDMSSATKIKQCIKKVANVLKDKYPKAQDKYKQYVDFHDDLVSRFTQDGMTGGFDYNSFKKVDANPDPMYTVFISDWDKDARYRDANDGFLTSDQGVALGRFASWMDSPLAYYMAVGGAADNAAAVSPSRSKTAKTYTTVAWQFSETQAAIMRSKKPSVWSSLSGKVTYDNANTHGIDNLLLYNLNEDAGLGSDVFPGAVVASQEIADLLEEDAQRPNGIYHPYNLTESTTGGVVVSEGLGYPSSNGVIRGFIGYQSGQDESVLHLKDTDEFDMYGIHVNPKGLFCSWTDGSIESVLESAWINYTFRTEKTEDDMDELVQTIAGFYQDFYGYELSSSEIDQILAGPEKLDD